MRTESQECFKCGDCQKQFAKRMDYNRHRKRHDKPHVCSQCKKPFGLKTDLERHRQTHLGRKSRQYMTCFPGCNFKTTRKDYFWTHLQKKHPGKEQHDASRKTLREYYDEFTQGPWTSQQDLSLQLLEGAQRYGEDLAAAQGHLDIVALLCQNAAVASKTLQKAVNRGKQEVVGVLIKNGVDINQLGIASGDPRRRTALYRAVLKEDEAMIHFLLDHEADINRRQPDDSNITALHLAVGWSTGAVTTILLKGNADIEAKDGTGRTPLDRAIEFGFGGQSDRYMFYPLTTRLLLEAGAVVDQRQWDAIPRWFQEENPQYAPSTATSLPVNFPFIP